MVEEARIQCVVVLYGQYADRCDTILALERLGREHTDLATHFAVLLYDNSPQPHAVAGRLHGFAEVGYRHNPANPGLAEAYTLALRMAEQRGLAWLLLLDQDTRLTADCMRELAERVAGPLPGTTGVLAPKLQRDGVLLSPELVGRHGNRPVGADAQGELQQEAMALNAGSCLRVAAVVDSGGFPADFPLDYLDHVMHHALARRGWRIFVLNSVLEHGLSLANLQQEMSLERYRRVLGAEWRFVRISGRSGGLLLHRVRLLKRALMQLGRFRDKRFAAASLRTALLGSSL